MKISDLLKQLNAHNPNSEVSFEMNDFENFEVYPIEMENLSASPENEKILITFIPKMK